MSRLSSGIFLATFLISFLFLLRVSYGSDKKTLLKVGDKAPDFTLTDPSGKSISLSSLKGKVVLIDFWASWCGYCKVANEEFIPIYNKYKSNGFEIFSISLDEKKDLWVNAIKAQKLSWPSHASDLKGWDSKTAALYGVEVLPTTFLIDEHGVIIEKDLDEYDLEKKLNWLFFEQVHFYPHVATTKIFFTAKAKYQIEDLKGKILLKGKDLEVDIASLNPGEYIIKYEEKTEKFTKKSIVAPLVTFFPERADDKITMSREADFEIINNRGKVIKKGKAVVIDISGFASGSYHLSIEGNVHSFFKK